ncbi:putative rab6 gtpase activating protein, gapcena [Operophtera brumata]|uniref:Putative rab6 gtpase activating protein, gapcena n=1 Tax=Operophtera brumata TaxID=104452 RepID=A0A0L7L9L1_OPEBR|nr:putative rab6 gtpase activating protein, gapcena [Operophtera brumata]
MEFNEYRTKEVLAPVDVGSYLDRSRTPSPSPVLSTNVSCDLEDILSDAISETLQGSLRASRSQLINQELTIRPEANIESNVPEGLDLYNIIFEVESDTDRMSDGAAAQNNTVKDQVSFLCLVL